MTGNSKPSPRARGAAYFLGGAAVLLVACSGAPYVSVANLPPTTLQTSQGLIAAGDIVDVRVFGQDALSTKGLVHEDGLLTLPLIGVVKASGETPAHVAQLMKERLKPYVNSPEVTVVIQQSLVSIAVLGEVKQVGVVQLESPATVLHALAKAGGMTDFADTSEIYVLRKLAGAVRRIRFEYDLLVGADAASINFRLRTGDVVVVE